MSDSTNLLLVNSELLLTFLSVTKRSFVSQHLKNKKILFLYKEFKDNIKLRREFKMLNNIVIYATTL